MARDDKEKYYWIKLQTDFFSDDSPIDWLLDQENGAEYVLLYIKLCLVTANNQGILGSLHGNVITPFTPNKIARDMKFFSIDTVIVALELYKKLGLIEEVEDAAGMYRISNHEEMVGSETKGAARKRKYRNEIQLKSSRNLLVDNLGDNENAQCPQKVGQCPPSERTMSPRGQCPPNVRTMSPQKSDNVPQKVGQCPIEKEEEKDISSSSIYHRFIYNARGEIDFEKVRTTYNKLCTNFVRSENITQATKENIRSVLDEYSADEVVFVLMRANNSQFLSDRNKNWQTTLDWVFNPHNFRKIAIGKYDSSYRKSDDPDWILKNKTE